MSIEGQLPLQPEQQLAFLHDDAKKPMLNY